MTDFEWAALVALVEAYGAEAIIEAVKEIAAMDAAETAEGDDHANA